jgi:uncharacterized protein YqjF (DUF2071 family)
MNKLSGGRDSTSQAGKVFLTAEWQDLVMPNYEVDPLLLRQYVPAGTELGSFERKTYMSLVGFRFRHTKVAGTFPIPLHTNFEEVNLRFYVCRKMANKERRGVVFIAEIVPRRMVTQIAREVYGENYIRLPMRHFHRIEGTERSVGYEWRVAKDCWCGMRAEVSGSPAQPAERSLEQFITEHYWGYSTRTKEHSLEYQVEHPRWRVWRSKQASLSGETASIYGWALAGVLRRSPDSAFVADGSRVTVYTGQRIA